MSAFSPFSTSVDGAMPNGTRAVKVGSDDGDVHGDGAACTVRGSAMALGTVVYCVEWDDLPGVPVAIVARRLRRGDFA